MNELLDLVEWKNPGNREHFRSGILTTVLMAKNQNMTLWLVIKMLAYTWFNKEKEMAHRTGRWNN